MIISSYTSILLQEICHRDLKLENTLLDGSPIPRVKICDFGYSKVSCFLAEKLSTTIIYLVGHYIFYLLFFFIMQSGLLHSQPKSTVGTPAYIAPEVLSRKEYDGKVCISSLNNSRTSCLSTFRSLSLFLPSSWKKPSSITSIALPWLFYFINFPLTNLIGAFVCSMFGILLNIAAVDKLKNFCTMSKFMDEVLICCFFDVKYMLSA